MLSWILLLHVFITLLAVHCLPVRRSVDSRTGELSDKLSELKALLDKLDTSVVTSKNVASGSNSRKEHSLKVVADASGTADLPGAVMETTGKDAQEKIVNMKKFVKTLTSEELRKLKAMKDMYENSKNTRNEEMTRAGSLAVNGLQGPRQTEEIINWKELAKRLHNGRDQPEIRPNHIEAETVEGSFGAFRDEIKYAVEKNLLTDVSLAIHSGISVDELLTDLLGPDDETSKKEVRQRQYRD